MARTTIAFPVSDPPFALLDRLREVAIFERLDVAGALKLLDLGVARTLPAGTELLTEGDVPGTVYAVLSGSLELVKRGQDGGAHTMQVLDAPTPLGEAALFDPLPSEVTATALVPTRVLAIDLGALREDAALLAAVREASLSHSAALLRESNAGLLAALEAREAATKRSIALGVMFVYVVSGLALYIVGLPALQRLDYAAGDVPMGTVLTLVLGTALSAVAIRRAGFPPAFFGVTLNGWQRSLREGIVFSLPVLAIITVIKWVILRQDPTSVHVLFDPMGRFLEADGRVDWRMYWTGLIVYSLMVPVQELVARGCLQTPLQRLLDGPRWRVVAASVLTSNMIFSTTHAHLGVGFAVVVFVPGLFWGWLRSRHETILGVIVSHWLVGVFVMYALGLGGLV
jgi:CRP-like cAMP-binding protein